MNSEDTETAIVVLWGTVPRYLEMHAHKTNSQ